MENENIVIKGKQTVERVGELLYQVWTDEHGTEYKQIMPQKSYLSLERRLCQAKVINALLIAVIIYLIAK